MFTECSVGIKAAPSPLHAPWGENDYGQVDLNSLMRLHQQGYTAWAELHAVKSVHNMQCFIVRAGPALPEGFCPVQGHQILSASLLHLLLSARGSACLPLCTPPSLPRNSGRKEEKWVCDRLARRSVCWLGTLSGCLALSSLHPAWPGSQMAKQTCRGPEVPGTRGERLQRSESGMERCGAGLLLPLPLLLYLLEDPHHILPTQREPSCDGKMTSSPCASGRFHYCPKCLGKKTTLFLGVRCT